LKRGLLQLSHKRRLNKGRMKIIAAIISITVQIPFLNLNIIIGLNIRAVKINKYMKIDLIL
jgi:hypothetical protein